MYSNGRFLNEISLFAASLPAKSLRIPCVTISKLGQKVMPSPSRSGRAVPQAQVLVELRLPCSEQELMAFLTKN
jgi:hypothetical protein